MTTAVLADRAYDGRGRHLTRGAMILIDAGRIQAVEPARMPPPQAARVIDLGDATLLPGFIDTHSHLTFNGELDPGSYFRDLDEQERLLRMRDAARLALRGGVTTLRDLGAPARLAMRVREEWSPDEPAPAILAAGAPLTTEGGHGHFMGGVVPHDPGAIREAVRQRHDQGADVIKLMLSGGRLTPGTDTSLLQFSDTEVAAAVDEAHRLGVPVTVHAYPPEAIAQAIDAGVDGVEHCFFSAADGLAPDHRTLDTLASTGTLVCPTLGLSPAWPVPPGFRAFLDVFYEVVAMMRAAGVTLVAGTDAGALTGKPHDVVPHAIATLARLGLSNREAIDAGTSTAAQACRVADRTGSIAVGLEADLVAVAGDPISRSADIANIIFVMRAGAVVRHDPIA